VGIGRRNQSPGFGSARTAVRAMKPENGLLRVAPGHIEKTNPNAVATFFEETAFSPMGADPRSDVGGRIPGIARSAGPSILERQEWDARPPSAKSKAHPNFAFFHRFPPSQWPGHRTRDWQNPEGVPLSAILFSAVRGRAQFPLVETKLFRLGATGCSWDRVWRVPRRRAAALGQGRRAAPADPFCHAAFLRLQHGPTISTIGLSFRRQRHQTKLAPRFIFRETGFRKDADGQNGLWAWATATNSSAC